MSAKSAAKQLFKFKTEPVVDLVEDGRGGLIKTYSKFKKIELFLF